MIVVCVCVSRAQSNATHGDQIRESTKKLDFKLKLMASFDRDQNSWLK